MYNIIKKQNKMYNNIYNDKYVQFDITTKII